MWLLEKFWGLVEITAADIWAGSGMMGQVLFVGVVAYAISLKVLRWLCKRSGKPVVASDLILAGVLAIFLGSVVALVGVVWQQWPKATPSQASVATPEVASAPPTAAREKTGETTKAKRFYSQRDKNDIADGLTDLSRLLDSQAAVISQRTGQIMSMWNPTAGTGDVDAVMSKIDEVRNLSVSFSRALFDSDNGFFKRYQTYNEEMASVVQLQMNEPSSPLQNLQLALNRYHDVVGAVQLSEKYKDKQLTSAIAYTSSSAANALRDAYNGFNRWIGETRERIKVMRSSLGSP